MSSGCLIALFAGMPILVGVIIMATGSAWGALLVAVGIGLGTLMAVGAAQNRAQRRRDEKRKREEEARARAEKERAQKEAEAERLRLEKLRREQEEQSRRAEEARRTAEAHRARLATEEAARKRREEELRQERTELAARVNALTKSLAALDAQLAFGDLTLVEYSARKSEMKRQLDGATLRLEKLGVRLEPVVKTKPAVNEPSGGGPALARNRYLDGEITRDEYEALLAAGRVSSQAQRPAEQPEDITEALSGLDQQLSSGQLSSEKYNELRAKLLRSRAT